MFTSAGVDLLLKGGLFNRTGYVAAFDVDGELDETSYARIGFALNNWRRLGRLYVNSGAMDFPEPTVAWPAITRWAYYSAASGGTRYLLDNLETPGSASEIGAAVGFDDSVLGAFVYNLVPSGISTTINIQGDDLTGTGAAVGSNANMESGQYFIISGLEIVRITGVGAGNTATIARAQLGTSAMAHSDGASMVQVNDDITELGSAACFSEGIVSGTRYLALKDSAFGDTLGSDLIDDPIVVMESEWTLSTMGSIRRARNNVVKSYGVQAMDEPVPMYVALADGNSGSSNVLWRSQFTTTPGDPGLGDNISHPPNSLSIGIAFA